MFEILETASVSFSFLKEILFSARFPSFKWNINKPKKIQIFFAQLERAKGQYLLFDATNPW